jgi:hypothetical protein
MKNSFNRVLKNCASRRDPALCGFCKCVVCPKIEGWEAGKLEGKPFMPFLASYRSSLQASSP